jgi:hypothetical protein
MSDAPHTASWARTLLASVWDPAWGPRAAREAGILAIARLETGFARWKAGSPCETSNNWGSMHSAPGSTDGCLAEDSHTDGTRYPQRFKTWPTPEEGLIAFVSLLRKRARTWAALATGSATELAIAMRKDLYYEGWGATEADRIAGYEIALTRASAATARELGAPSLALTRLAGSWRWGAALLVAALGGAGTWIYLERRATHD